MASASSSLSSKSLLPELQDVQSSTSSSVTNLHSREASQEEIPSRSPEAVSSPIRLKSTISQTLIPSSSPPKRFPSHANVASALSMRSPRGKKTGLETREELLNSLLGSPKSSMNESELVGSPKSKKTGLETGEELLNSLLAKTQSATGNGVTTPNVRNCK